MLCVGERAMTTHAYGHAPERLPADCCCLSSTTAALLLLSLSSSSLTLLLLLPACRLVSGSPSVVVVVVVDVVVVVGSRFSMIDADAIIGTSIARDTHTLVRILTTTLASSLRRAARRRSAFLLARLGRRRETAKAATPSSLSNENRQLKMKHVLPELTVFSTNDDRRRSRDLCREISGNETE